METKSVSDLGIAAFIMINSKVDGDISGKRKFKVISREGKFVYFDVSDDHLDEFDKLSLQYITSDFHRFDSHLMSLKKIPNYLQKTDKLEKSVFDLGIAAYISMHGYKVVGRKDKLIYFEVPDSDVKEFENLSYEYLNSDFHYFDSHLMSLKKLTDYSSR